MNRLSSSQGEIVSPRNVLRHRSRESRNVEDALASDGSFGHVRFEVRLSSKLIRVTPGARSTPSKHFRADFDLVKHRSDRKYPDLAIPLCVTEGMKGISEGLKRNVAFVFLHEMDGTSIVISIEGGQHFEVSAAEDSQEDLDDVLSFDFFVVEGERVVTRQSTGFGLSDHALEDRPMMT